MFSQEKCFEGVKISRSAHDSSLCSVNPKFLAVVVEVPIWMITYIVMITKIIMMIHLIIKVNVITGSDQVGGGGSFVVLPLERTGRVGQAAWKVNFLFVIVVTIPFRSHIKEKMKKIQIISLNPYRFRAMLGLCLILGKNTSVATPLNTAEYVQQ